MCLGTVCQVLSAPSAGQVLARGDGRVATVSLLTLTEPVATGDWLLVHCGLALARLTEAEAYDALRLRDSEVSP
jgi:hydrogenase assembly chaperone HypC/HupF